MVSTKRTLQLTAGIAISAIFLWLAFRDIEIAAVWSSIRAASLSGVVLTGAVVFLSILSRAQRWVPLFRPGAGVTVGNAFVAQCIGFAGNTVLPFRAGEALKAYALSQSSRQKFTTTLATVVLERVFDLLGVGATLGLALWLVPIPEGAGPQVSGAVRVLGVVAVGSVLGLVAFLFLRQRMLGLVDFVIDRLPDALGRPLHSIVHAFVDGLDALGSATQMVRVVILTLWVWATIAFPYSLLSVAFGFGETYSAPAWQVGIVCSAFIAVFVMIPAAPGFVGTFQAGCILALSIFGIPRSEALAFSLVGHFISLAPVTLLGLVLAFRQGVLGSGRAIQG